MSNTHTEVITSPVPAHVPRARRTAAMLGVAALAVGLGGGYVLRAGTEPAPVTKTVATTVTKTVQPSPYSTTTTQTVFISYDGTHAYYSGPNQVKAGTQLTFHVVSTAQHPIGAIAVMQVPADYTWEQSLAYTKDRIFGDPVPAGVQVMGWQVVPTDLQVTLTAGTYQVVIGLPPEGSGPAVLAGFVVAS